MEKCAHSKINAAGPLCSVFFLLLRNFCGDFGWYYLALLLIIQVLAVLSWKG